MYWKDLQWRPFLELITQWGVGSCNHDQFYYCVWESDIGIWLVDCCTEVRLRVRVPDRWSLIMAGELKDNHPSHGLLKSLREGDILKISKMTHWLIVRDVKPRYLPCISKRGNFPKISSVKLIKSLQL